MRTTRAGSGGLKRHLQEAIAVNTSRRAQYLSLTQGESKWLSWLLISSERLALCAAVYIDWRARPFQRAGIPIVERDFVSMGTLRPFEARTAELVQPLDQFKKQNAWELIQAIRGSFKHAGFAGVARCARSCLDTIAGIYTYHGMLRHLLESILRIAQLAEDYSKQADELKIASPAALSWTLIKLHLLALPLGVYLDQLAAPIQARGIPIIIQDVPPIDVGQD